VGAGASEGAMDASNMLKPALARGTLRCVGATTLNEYRKYIEKMRPWNAASSRCWCANPVWKTPSRSCAGLKEKYEVHHGVRIKDSAIVAAATLSHRYIADRFLPDKAIDLIDECASKLRIEIDSMPVEIDEIQRKITPGGNRTGSPEKGIRPGLCRAPGQAGGRAGGHAFPDCRHENPLGR
jgi:ATP-dependent Clp protease ATP-binding subunit ClpB